MQTEDALRRALTEAGREVDPDLPAARAAVANRVRRRRTLTGSIPLSALALGLVVLANIDRPQPPAEVQTIDRPPNAAGTSLELIRQRCESEGHGGIDLDEDGVTDRVYAIYEEHRGTRLGICSSTGVDEEVPGGENLSVIRPHEGPVLIVSAGSSASTNWGTVFVVAGGHLEELPLELVSGQDAAEGPRRQGTSYWHWGCREDEGGFGRLATVQISASPGGLRFDDQGVETVDPGADVIWSRRTYDIDGSSLREVSAETGTFQLPGPGEPWSGLTALAGACPTLGQW